MSNQISFVCPGCNGTVTIDVSAAGQTTDCPGCGQKCTVPVPVGQPVGFQSQGDAPKNKVIAGVLGLLFGTLGIHNFYIERTSTGVVQLVLTAFGFLTSCFVFGYFIILGVWLWATAEAILIFCGSISDGYGRPLE